MTKSGRPRLQDMEPVDVAEAFTRMSVERIRRMARRCRRSVQVQRDVDLTQELLYKDILAIGEYAIHGLAPSTPLEDLLANVSDHATPTGDINRESDPVRFLLSAAIARRRVEAGEAITSVELAALGGVTGVAVLAAIKREAIAVKEYGAPGAGKAFRITAKEARRWLARQGVVGFAKPD